MIDLTNLSYTHRMGYFLTIFKSKLSYYQLIQNFNFQFQFCSAFVIKGHSPIEFCHTLRGNDAKLKKHQNAKSVKNRCL